VFNAHLEAFANQVEGLRANGQLSGVERGSLAEALLAVAGPSGPARVRDVLRWLLEPVRARWVPAPGAASGDIAALASLAELAKGETGGSNGGSQGLSAAHWELFHDVQLAERCLRRSGGDHEPSASAEKKSTTAAANIPAGLVQPVDPPPPVEECPAADHLEWVLTMCNALCASVHRVWTPRGHEEARAVGLDRALAMSPEEQAAHLVHGPARTFALSGGGSPPPSATVTATRDWLRGLRDAAYAMMTLLSTHAPGAFYPSESVARAVSDAAYRDLQHMHDRHARFLLHALARPVLGRCPAAHRPLWHAALTSTLSPMMTERLARAWAKVKAATELSKEERERDLTHAAGAGGVSGGGSGGGENTGGGSIVLEDLIHERVTRDLSRDYCALLELIAIPEGTFGRKTKGSGLTGHLAGVVGGGNDSPKGGGAKGSAMDASTAHGGGKHVRDWMRAVAAVDASGAPARGAISTATAALSWGDSEAVGRALHFLRGVTACAAAPDGDQSLRETAGAEILPACIGGLSVPSNSSHQARSVMFVHWSPYDRVRVVNAVP
jgi:exportin-5